MADAINDILADWRIDQIPAFFMRERIVVLKADIEAGIQAAEDYVSDADNLAAQVTAEKQLEGLRAVRKVLVGELEAID